MLHRLKLRLLYGPFLDADRPARRRKRRIILLSGLWVYLPFLWVAYALYRPSRPLEILWIGGLASAMCVPVGGYAYASGSGRAWTDLWQERKGELIWFLIKIGFLYAFCLYGMILGMVEFVFGYSAFRAALISFMAAAVARDGFEIGYLAERPELMSTHPTTCRHIFPDGRASQEIFRQGSGIRKCAVAGVMGGGMAALLMPWLTETRLQTLATGVIAGGIATFFYRGVSLHRNPSLWRYFLWPGMVMGCSYFFILAYGLRMITAQDFRWGWALLTACCCIWNTHDALAIGHWKNVLFTRKAT